MEANQVPFMGKWTNKIWYIHTMECYSDLRRKEVLVHVTTWMILEAIMLSHQEFLGCLVIKDLILSLLWLGFHPRLGNVYMLWVWPKKLENKLPVGKLITSTNSLGSKLTKVLFPHLILLLSSLLWCVIIHSLPKNWHQPWPSASFGPGSPGILFILLPKVWSICFYCHLIALIHALMFWPYWYFCVILF